MRRVLWAAALLVLASGPLPVATSAENSGPLKALVRVYPDWRVDPRAYVTLTVPLQGLYVTPGAVRREYGSGEREGLPLKSGEMLVVALPDEQEDRGVTRSMQGMVYTKLLRQGAMALRPTEAAPAQRKPYLFVDASGNPIADAKVEVLIGEDEFAYSVLIGEAQLDAEGLLEPPQLTSKR